MMAYEHFTYIDTQKTGSTFIVKFLRTHAKGEPLRFNQHRYVDRKNPPEGLVDEGHFYFTSCREPLDQYRSLYVAGCEGKGAIRKFNDRNSTALVDTYDGTPDGFCRWLGFLTGPDRTQYLVPKVQRAFSAELGLMGCRFLALNLDGKPPELMQDRPRVDLEAAWRDFRLPHTILRQENLRAEFAEVIAGPLRPYMRKPARALRVLDTRQPANAAKTRSSDMLDAVPPDLRDRVRQLEWFHYDHLGYGDAQGQVTQSA